MNLDNILQTIMIGSAILMILAILLQQRGATLGAGFGASWPRQDPLRGDDLLGCYLCWVYFGGTLVAVCGVGHGESAGEAPPAP